MLVAWRLISQFHQRCIHEKIMADECVFANLTIDDFFSNVHMRILVLRVKLHFILCNAEGKKVKKALKLLGNRNSRRCLKIQLSHISILSRNELRKIKFSKVLCDRDTHRDKLKSKQ